MIVKDIADSTLTSLTVEIRNESNKRICITSTKSEGIKPYEQREVISWGTCPMTVPKIADFWLQIKDVCIYQDNKGEGKKMYKNLDYIKEFKNFLAAAVEDIGYKVTAQSDESITIEKKDGSQKVIDKGTICFLMGATVGTIIRYFDETK